MCLGDTDQSDYCEKTELSAGSCSLNPCDVRATCKELVGGGYSCKCVDGWSGNGLTCIRSGTAEHCPWPLTENELQYARATRYVVDITSSPNFSESCLVGNPGGDCKMSCDDSYSHPGVTELFCVCRRGNCYWKWVNSSERKATSIKCVDKRPKCSRDLNGVIQKKMLGINSKASSEVKKVLLKTHNIVVTESFVALQPFQYSYHDQTATSSNYKDTIGVDGHLEGETIDLTLHWEDYSFEAAQAVCTCKVGKSRTVCSYNFLLPGARKSKRRFPRWTDFYKSGLLTNLVQTMKDSTPDAG